jgi:hypothetical protein
MHNTGQCEKKSNVKRRVKGLLFSVKRCCSTVTTLLTQRWKIQMALHKDVSAHLISPARVLNSVAHALFSDVVIKGIATVENHMWNKSCQAAAL